MTQEIRVDLSRARVELAPGETETVDASLRNTSDVVQHLVLEVVGLPPGSSASSTPDVFKLMPGATAAATVSITLPEHPPAPAGRSVLGVLVHSPHESRTSRCEELELQVSPEPAMSMLVEPSLVTGGARAVFRAQVTNDGNTRLPVQLTASDAEQQVRLAFSPPSLELRPGESGTATLTAAAPVAWTGPDRRRSLSLRAIAPEVSAEAPVTFVQQPRLAGGLVRALGAALAVLVLAAAVLGASWLSGRQDEDRRAGAGEQTPTTLPSASAEASPGPTAEPSAPPTEVPTPTSDPTTDSTPTSEPERTAEPTGEPSPPEPVTRTVDVASVPGGPAARPVPGGQFSAQGVQLAGVADEGAGTCADATSVAAHGDGADTYLTAATATDLTSCQAAPLLLGFPSADAPVTRVAVTVREPGTYAVRTEITGAAAGAVQEVTVGADGVLEVAAPEGGRLTALVLSRPAAASDPAVVGVRRLLLVGPGP